MLLIKWHFCGGDRKQINKKCVKERVVYATEKRAETEGADDRSA